MRTFTRLSLMAGVAVFAQMASAAISYDVLQANIAYQDGHTFDLNVAETGNSITFSSPAVMGVGDGFWAAEGHAAAVVTIIYTVVSDDPITGVGLVFTGTVGNLGKVDYSELIEAWSPTGGAGSIISSTDGEYKGAGFQGGIDGGFTNETLLSFDGVNSYKVKKTFTLLDLDNNLAGSYATLGIIEQNAVPEPASMGALAIGALGLLARRRRNK